MWLISQKNKWVTVSFRATPLSSLYTRCEFFGTTGLCTKVKVTYQSHTHTHMLTHIVSGHFWPQCCRGKHYTISISRLSTNEHDLMTASSPASRVMLNPSPLPFPFSLPAQSDHWKVSSHHFLCINSSTAAMHLWYHKSLCKEMCVRVCVKRARTDAVGQLRALFLSVWQSM